ncbi:hypothetical protein PHYBOEH_008431 [Phytophthora boehmeriae]|uniref:Uncharacterized protein n=1 Tax=Phytophthora boehmeriae TaxID=109152 RepID=A0A8T1W4I5_9STRA|nr:hypothetical protein PHYBOEH_008431 [Phytophthora boehmeriae]
MAPSPPLQVASASFFRLECDHEELFRSEYKRSNRTKGLKILRCFPHCCPEHIDRSYCGSSLSVQVQIAERPSGTAPPQPPPSDVLSVFARFEAVSDVSLRAGECVEVDKIQQGIQTESNLEGQWIGGVQDRPSGLVAAIRPSDASSQDDQTLVFHLNGKSFSRWYYDWESGANKAQRLMKHVLKAYIVERCAVDMDDNFTTISSREAFTQLYRVMHVISSPEFTVISYRRAPLEQLQAAQAALLANNTGTPPGGPPQKVDANIVKVSATRNAVSHAKRAFVPERYHRDLYSSPQSAAGAIAISRDRNVATWAQQTARYEPESKRRRRLPKRSMEQLPVHPLENKLLWEHSNEPAVSVSKNLALLYSFLNWAHLGLYSSFVDELVTQIEQKVIGPLSTTLTQASSANFFTQLLLQHRTKEDTEGREANRDPPSPPIELETLLRVASQTTLWLFSKETLLWLRKFFRQHAECVLNKTALRACFISFLRELEERLNAQVFASTTLRNLTKVAEEVIAAVYSYRQFHDKRPSVRRILSGQSFAGWGMFVAQMRDTYVNIASMPRTPRTQGGAANSLLAHRPRTAIERDWNGTWLLDMENARWDGSNRSSTDGHKGIAVNVSEMSLLSLFKLISQIARLEVVLGSEGGSLMIRSTLGVSGRLDCMRVVLDGKDRVFRLFPNGFATIGDDDATGDYFGEMRVEEQNQLAIYLEMFKWAMEEGKPSYHARMRIAYRRDARLVVDGDILTTTTPITITAEEIPYVADMPLRAKRKMVERAYARLHQDDNASQEPISAWREHSKFQLCYAKV